MRWGVTVAFFVFGGMLLWLVEGQCNSNEDYIEPSYKGMANQRLGDTLKAVYAHRNSDSRLSQRGFLIKPTVNQKFMQALWITGWPAHPF